MIEAYFEFRMFNFEFKIAWKPIRNKAHLVHHRTIASFLHCLVNHILYPAPYF